MARRCAATTIVDLMCAGGRGSGGGFGASELELGGASEPREVADRPPVPVAKHDDMWANLSCDEDDR